MNRAARCDARPTGQRETLSQGAGANLAARITAGHCRAGRKASRPIMSLAFLSLLALSACGEDETDIRAEVARVLSPTTLVHFDSTADCTVAVYATNLDEVKSSVVSVSSVDEALRRIKQGDPVLFDHPDVSPNVISREIATKAREIGITVVSSGVGGRACMSEEIQRAYREALTRNSAALILNMQREAIILLDRDARQIFYVRGDVL